MRDREKRACKRASARAYKRARNERIFSYSFDMCGLWNGREMKTSKRVNL